MIAQFLSDTWIISTSQRVGLIDIEITEENEMKKLEKLRHDKAGGGELTPKLLITIRNEISYQLTLLFWKSLAELAVPTDWKSQCVTNLQKGSKSTAENYRPVSLTSQCSKLMEAITRDEIVEYIEASKLLNDSQHGFRAGWSCLTNILVFLDKVTEWMGNGFRQGSTPEIASEVVKFGHRWEIVWVDETLVVGSHAESLY